MTRSPAASVFAAAVLWGTTGLAAAYAPTVSPLVIGAVAMGGGGLLQIVANSEAMRANQGDLRRNTAVTVVGALCAAVYPLAFYSSMRVGGVALGTVVSLASAPMASAVIERVLDDRALTVRWMIACLVGIAGSTALCLTENSDGPGSSVPLGVALGLVAGATYAGYSWTLRRLMNRHVPRGAATGAVLGLGGVILAPIAVIGLTLTASIPTTAWLVLVYLAIVPMFLGYVLFSRGLAGVDATTATTITLVEPAVATLLAVVILHEHLGVRGWTGMALLALALVILVTPARRT
ncbi:MAG TPA: EamA family transporter [Gordonia sp. (in: high G+C Gram-positive bacteria)]|uniref:DMT family transporter n=1 Tax=unclassified Gordonia (in: high G+C Gram-positive bacteria) TaxID=2657482 RepID=UPI0025C47F79|nr:MULTISPECIES: EamA family transporter [unclassified Gordonia (in: high G+C Gram-positive bacteria)]HNP56099.1 EamA family transporter [Gordonia sp. (in: high G+C Gram-positive bacteria)]HRC49773.1 EamA family transporter [Gordonia sp. (in: high G+C Gram-positive bacteria)]